MASFTAGTTFVDGVSNDVTAAKLGALVTNATPTSGFIQDRTAETVTATNDTLLIGDASDSNNLKRITVANFAQTLPTAKVTTGTIETGTFGTTTSTAATITALTTGTGTAAAPAIVPTGDTNTGIFFPAADTIAFSEGGTEGMRIDSSGRVGINVTSPLYKLQVDGDAALTDTSSLYWATAGGTTRTSITGDSSGNLKLQTGASNTERLRIDSSGNVGIGVTPSSGYRFTSKGATATSAGYNLLCQNSSGSTCLLTRDDGLVTTGLLANSPYNYTTGGAANAAIFSDGNLGRSTSSIKYKKDVVSTNHGLLDVMKLRPVTYRGKSENDGNTVFGGLIAEEVHDAGLTEFVQYADDGTPDALSYGNMVSLAFKAIQEQQAIIEELKNKVAALEAA